MLSEKNLMVSIIIPCRNEEKFIGKCLDSIIDNDYPKDKLEVLVIDGISEDKTRDIIKKYTQKYSFINLLDNHKKIVPLALNIGVVNSKGKIIIRMDAHNTYNNDYVSKCVKYLEKYNVDNVGGKWITLPGADTIVAKAIAIALSHPFGVGNAAFRIGSTDPKYVDTVPFGCYRREVFDKIGLFNEKLIRNQDIEFNLRLKRISGKILLIPDIISYYCARSNLKDLFRQNFLNGFWVFYSLKFAKIPFSIRHLIPFFFVFTLVFCAITSCFYSSAIYLFFFLSGIYLITNIFLSFIVSLRNGSRYFTFLIMSFIVLHFSYGFGSFWGLIRLARLKRGKT